MDEEEIESVSGESNNEWDTDGTDEDDNRIHIDMNLLPQMVAGENNVMIARELNVIEQDRDIDDYDLIRHFMSTHGRVPYDVTASATHPYLLNSECVDVDNATWLEPGSIHELPSLRSESVVLPGQGLPLKLSYPPFREALVAALNQKTYLALCYVVNEKLCEIGTLLQLTKFIDDGRRVKGHAIARQRFRLLSTKPNENSCVTAEIRVLDDIVLPSWTEAVLPNVYKGLSTKSQLELTYDITGVPVWAVNFYSTKCKCDELITYMKNWYSEEKIERIFSLGLIEFINWVSNHIPIPLKEKYDVLQEDVVDRRMIKLLEYTTKVKISCSHCKIDVAELSDFVSMTSEGVNALFINSAGYTHEMITLNDVHNFIRIGGRKKDYSWFRGYSWQIIECSECGSHLGWEFVSARFNPKSFFGLSRRAIAPV